VSSNRQVIIGVDPHKLSATIEAVDPVGVKLGEGRFATDKAGFAAMKDYVNRIQPEQEMRVWAVEGANGAGRSLAQRLLAAGEQVVDVPAKLAARVRLFDTGHNRKTDALDAHSIAMVAVSSEHRDGLRVLARDDELEAIRMLCDRRDELSRMRVQTVNRIHRLLAELVPGTKKKDLSAAQAKAILATVRPRDIAGKTRRRMVVELIEDLTRIDRRLKTMKAEQAAAVRERGSTLLDLYGIGPAGAARILADVGDVARFADRNRFASWTGTAPLDASSGEQIRHRLSRAGNRRMNHVIYIAAVVQIRNDTPGREYYRRKLAAGKTPLEALRCLKRRISDAIYRQLLADARRGAEPAAGEDQPENQVESADEQRGDGAGPGGHCGATHQSSATDLTPHVGTSDKPLHGPAESTLQPTGAAPEELSIEDLECVP
jgi:transposase